jgi:hypothetical protein
VNKLKDLIKSLEKNFTVKVGILGDKSSRSDGMSNAEIGMKHEFGEDNMPQRSFLRMPISTEFKNKLEGSQKFFQNKELEKQIIEEKSLKPVFEKLGIVAETVIKEAFATGGFGKWKAHSPGYKNNTGQILVDSTQLRDSITSEVVDDH